MNKILNQLNVDCLLVNFTNEYLAEYPDLSENARYTLTGFSGSTGDALLTEYGIFLFVDGRYHAQADREVFKGVTVVKMQLGQNQDEEIIKYIEPSKTLGIVSKKVSQKRLEFFEKRVKVKMLEIDPVNNHIELHPDIYEDCGYSPKPYTPQEPVLVTDLEEVSYLTGLRDFSNDGSSKIWQKLFVHGKNRILFKNSDECDEFLKNFDGKIITDKSSINAYDYSLIKNPVNKQSEIRHMKAVKTDEEIELYQQAFEATDRAVAATRDYIERNDSLSEYDISEKLRNEFLKYGAKSLSFNSIVAIDKNSALAHYSQNLKDVILKEGSLVLIDCGAYYKSGLATDITRVFVKGSPSNLQKKVYTTVLKAFLNCYNSNLKTGFERDALAHKILDGAVEGFTFSHGLGHGLGINVHEAPPALNKSEIAHTEILDNMCFTIEPGLYNPEFFGIRLENSCYKSGKTVSFVKTGYEGKLIDYGLLTPQECKWLEEFDVL